jgi:hypothetical protein
VARLSGDSPGAARSGSRSPARAWRASASRNIAHAHSDACLSQAQLAIAAALCGPAPECARQSHGPGQHALSLTLSERRQRAHARRGCGHWQPERQPVQELRPGTAGPLPCTIRARHTSGPRPRARQATLGRQLPLSAHRARFKFVIVIGMLLVIGGAAEHYPCRGCLLRSGQGSALCAACS